MARFDGKKVLITGGTSGIGLATAERIAAEGGRVMVTGTNPEHIEEAKRRLPDGSIAIANDAGDPAAAADLAGEVKEYFGGLEALFLNAGYGASDEASDAEAFDRINNVNVRGPVLQMQQLDALLADGASVLLTSSVAPHIGSAFAVYALTKSACATLARSWAVKYAPRRIRCNAVAPGPIETRFFDRIGPDAKEAVAKRVGGMIPLGRFGTAAEVAAVATFLLSDDASYVTGSEYMVDGGMTRR